MKIAVTANHIEKINEARQLAKKLHLTFLDPASPHHPYQYLIMVAEDYIGIQSVTGTKTKPFYIDFNNGKLLYRLKQTSFKKELLARAIGVKPQPQSLIIDATAGLGRDSLILAALGFNIVLLERSPILSTLLKDAMNRGAAIPRISPCLQRMQLIEGDAIDWLPKLSKTEKPDVIYLDPMFPNRQKTALVKKEMILLQNIIGKDIDAGGLFNIALSCAGKRVVVKRPRLSPNIVDIAPNFMLMGKKNRFDVYLT